MQKTSAALKLGLGAAAAFALTLGGIAPAFAADVQIGPDNVAPYQVGTSFAGGVETKNDGFNYDQWHIGSELPEGQPLNESIEFADCSVTTLTPSAGAPKWVQVMKGFPMDERPTSPGEDTADVEALLDSVAIHVLAGDVTIQIPMFEYTGEPGNSDPRFTTVRSASLGVGTHALADLPITHSGGFLNDVNIETLGQLIAHLQSNPDFSHQILGVGFNGNEGASVQSLSFDGDTYTFSDGNCGGETPVDEADPTAIVAPTPPAKIDTAA